MVHDVIASDTAFAPTGSDMGGEARWIDIDGIRTRYFDVGSGAPIVMIHGSNPGTFDDMSFAETWALNVSVLGRHHNAIALDRLGQGHTDNPKRDADYTMHAFVQHAIAFLDKLGRKPYHLIGHSRGGYIVMRITMERPDLVATVIPVSSGTTAPGPTRTHAAHRDPPEPRPTMQSLRWYLERYSWNRIEDEAWLKAGLEICTLPKHLAAIEKMEHGRLAYTQFMPQLFRQKEELHRHILEKGLERPTLVMWGWNDPGADIENGLRLIEMLMLRQRQTEVRLFNRCGHFVMREHPAAFNRLVDSWIRAHM